MLGNETSIHLETWPEYDAQLLVEEEVTIAVQVNGKVRGEITIAADASEREVTKQTLELEAIQKWLGGEEPKRIVYVPQKLLNIVV